ncbi:hypothetical protein N657DRAFT_568158 [Parathielavia appendiculata]|uniref:Rhodopsin domain-containing protein n=1 Tax=Parathielavia appendiculata TaxID=2587402 RepID=A0AAN6Z4P2_9PEZI|nr:hypothetical protein N657DRAFT_568158 [Parathielavia appendiculata]
MDSSTEANFPWTPEQLAVLPHDNAAPKLLSSIWALFAVATLFLTLRVYCRILKRRSLWWDDYILIAAWVCSLIECSLLTHMTTLGYGLHIWDFDWNNFQAIMVPTLASGTFSITAAVWSKTSFGITLLHITDGWYKKVTWFCIISMNVFMFLSALFPWVDCTPISSAWDMSVKGTCWDIKVTVYYDIFSSGYSALMDIVLAILPWKFLWGLQMKPKEKIGVIAAMSLGMFAGATAIVKTTQLPDMLSADFADGVPLWIWGNAETCASIVASSIPMLRVLVKEAASSRGYKSGGYFDRGTGVTGNHSRFVTISSRPAPTNSELELHKLGDDRSDRSILGNNPNLQVPQAKNGIVQVTDIVVKYDEENAQGK